MYRSWRQASPASIITSFVRQMEVGKEEESEVDGCEVDDQPSELRRKVLSGSALVLRRRNKWIRRDAAWRSLTPGIVCISPRLRKDEKGGFDSCTHLLIILPGRRSLYFQLRLDNTYQTRRKHYKESQGLARNMWMLRFILMDNRVL